MTLQPYGLKERQQERGNTIVTFDQWEKASDDY